MYTLFIKKRKGDRVPFGVHKIIREFIVRIVDKKCRNIVVFPGYLSGNSNTAKEFANNFFDVSQMNNILIFSGMNKSYLNTTSTEFNNVSNVNCSGIIGNRDHRKMVFILEGSLNLDLKKLGEEKYLQEEIDQIKILAVMIGSSNFSKTTYYGDANKADKGEADLFMFENNEFKDFIIEEFDKEDDIVVNKQTDFLSKSISNNISDTQQFFRRLLVEAIIDQNVKSP